MAMRFLDGLDDDIKKNLLEELRVLWTYSSTTIEGNTLTLGETAFVLKEGLTIQGKPLKDHRDVEGHARAVDLLLSLVNKDTFVTQDLFDLHRLVMNEQLLDVLKPVGDWKKENNSTNVTLANKQQIMEFSNFWEVPELMTRWLALLNYQVQMDGEPEDVLSAYARLHISFTTIHPFWDGNGRVARLVSNLPCLKAGYPPIVIDNGRRYEYLTTLAEHVLANGVPNRKTEIIHESPSLERFRSFCGECWEKSQTLVREAHELQKNRREKAKLFL
ncbi:MAG: Fic/DOC family protein [Syntrophorhabdaceae bacterium PtaU1.Bin034]|nr:MAG: Fic/DOC family protein [Syntrophorhabdaceae bacterium PtaU1.Bin034]